MVSGVVISEAYHYLKPCERWQTSLILVSLVKYERMHYIWKLASNTMKFTLLIFSAYLLLGCNTNKNQSSKKIAETNTIQTEYSNKSVKIFEDGFFIEEPESIKNYNSKNPLYFDSLVSIYSIEANDDFIYEISSFKSERHLYKQMLITESDTHKRAFEFIVKAQATNSNQLLGQIDLRRDQWIEYCNGHDARILVTELYSDNALYFNHKPVIAHRDSLIKEYNYMNSQKYSLRMDPLHVEIVRSDLVFEIGQCSGSYNGKYILIWKKDGSREWNILVDSNI